MTKAILCAAAILVCAASLLAEDDDLWAPVGGRIPVPEGARVTLEVDRGEVLVGENVLLHFKVANVGKAPFRISQGGDYRGSIRALRFQVTAIDQDGVEAADPDPGGMCMGGISTEPEIAPGECWYATLPLLRYRRIHRAGTWTIRVRHDLGFSGTEARPIPAAEIRLRFSLPTPDQARRVVEEMGALAVDPDWHSGKKRAPYADFWCLSHPVYLPVLREMAWAGSEPALRGLSEMRAVEATRLLVDLLGHGDAAFARSAARTLNLRLPDPTLEGELPYRTPFRFLTCDEKRKGLAAAWRPDLAPAVRAWARARLESDDREAFSEAGFVLQCLGEEEDVAVVSRALDRAIEREKGLVHDKEWWPRPGGEHVELVRAAEMFVRRGFDVPASPEGHGEAILTLQAIRLREDARPAGWEETLERLLDHEIPWMRFMALSSVPDPVPEFVRSRLPDLLADRMTAVRSEACRLAGRAKARELIPAIRGVLETTGDPHLLREASNTLWALGAPLVRMKALASRLGDMAVNQEALSALLGWIENRGYGGSGVGEEEAPRLKARWERFAAEHADEVRAGKRWRIGDPAVTPDLLPKGFSLGLEDGGSWPPGAR